jgi:hypothetical protein
MSRGARREEHAIIGVCAALFRYGNLTECIKTPSPFELLVALEPRAVIRVFNRQFVSASTMACSRWQVFHATIETRLVCVFFCLGVRAGISSKNTIRSLGTVFDSACRVSSDVDRRTVTRVVFKSQTPLAHACGHHRYCTKNTQSRRSMQKRWEFSKLAHHIRTFS